MEKGDKTERGRGIKKETERDRERAREGGCELAFTGYSSGAQPVSHGTFTAERAVCVDTLAIIALLVDALINIYS